MAEKIIELSESQIQKGIIAVFRIQYPQHCWEFTNEKKKIVTCQWLKASLNGVNLGSGVKVFRIINSLKAQGMLSGESDLELPIPNIKFNGLFLELKIENGKQQPSQIAFEEASKAIGWDYQIARSIDEGMKIIDNHLTT